VWTDPGVYLEKLRLEHSASNYRKKKSIECQVGRKTIQSIAGHGHDDPRVSVKTKFARVKNLHQAISLKCLIELSVPPLQIST
jgi:hypothetical protein